MRVPEVPLGFPKMWLEFTDPADPDQIVRCDATWLTSHWTCVYGRGCQGIDAEYPDHGCCVYGAHLCDDEDRDRVGQWVSGLTPETWQFHGAVPDWWEIDGADLRTATVEGGCVFLNRRGFSGGEGCALHLAAVQADMDPLVAKPDVCWQLPIRRDYTERTDPDGREWDVVEVGEYDRGGWGPGGHDLDWYCSTATEAHVGREPVYVSERAALVELLGEGAYVQLVRMLEGVTGGPRHPADPV